ncbi:MAG: VIT domain-containing protein [Akkermansiaceae bacterium]|nr:VIT domain-containing protein [Akkermansiaceae bacterium]
MRPLISFFVILFANLCASVRSAPELTVQGPRGERASLSIASFETKTVFFEDLAKTTITVTFLNPSKRAIEGEFAMPLPPGATVSGYALDVNGRMRESSVVEKERARFAYESIKRQMIDPGFVEREEGNVYRTKIFPIPAEGTKAVRLSYCEIINPKEGHYDYHLPLPEVSTSSCKLVFEHLEGKALTFRNPDQLAFRNESPGFYRADADKQQLPPGLVVRLPGPASPGLIKAGNYFYFRKTAEEIEPPLIPNDARAIQIVWDCSESGRLRNHAREFAFLENLFQQQPNLQVKLTLLHLETSPGGDFGIKNGNWVKLKEVLSKIFYDGANDLAAITCQNLPTLVFSDGHSHFSFLRKNWSSPVTLIDSLGKASSYWRQQAWLSGGTSIDLGSQQDRKPPINPVRNFSFQGAEEKIPSNIEGRSINEPRIIKLISTLWAQKKLNELEAEFTPPPQRIIAHCKKYHLVSNLTSLIVLERFSDYVRYRIPPPEPDLRAKYDAEIDRKSDRRRLAKKISDIWKWRKTWHSTHFPWQERLLVPALRRMTLWKKALERTFTPDELNPTVRTTITNLEKEISTLFKARREKHFTTDAEYRAWLKQLGATSENIQKIHTIPAGAITPENKMAVAVNGMVNQPGKIISIPDLTLLNAVKKAGGISSFGSGSRISVYRGAKKTTYNTLSKQYNDVPLKPGDLIVVEQEMKAWDESFDVDPFSSDRDLTRRSFNHADEPAIVENPNNDFISSSGAGGGGGYSDPFGGAPVKKTGEKITFTKIPPAPGMALSLIKDAMKGGKSPEAVYQSLRLKDRYEDDFYLNLGDLLFEKKEPALANRVLSNLIEGPSPKPAAYRKWAYLLAKHSDWKGAREILNAIALHFPDDQALSLDLAWINTRLKEKPIAIKDLAKAIDSFDSTKQATQNLAELATVEYRRLTEQAPLPLDLRIVVSSASGQDLNLRIEEPSTTTSDFPNWPSINMIGSRSYESVGVAEYAIRHAVPGAYTLTYRSGAGQIVRVQIYRNWRRSNESLEIEKIFILPAAKQNSEILTYNFELE